MRHQNSLMELNYQVFSLKYRPQTLDELWGQDHVKLTLKHAIEKNRTANAYLFCGPRGVGKTTTARILAKNLNCEKGPTVKPCNECSLCKEITNSRSLDVLEIDGASNRGIDQIRELRENIKYVPAHSKYKIYIIDEVHMLTPEAFNALLKTLEEPPRHVKFIFATTAPFKVPPTILSRCQRFDFRKIPAEEIVERLRWISEKETLKVEEEAFYCIARRADGSFRDAESLLDQLHSYSPDTITLKAAEELLGILPTQVFSQYTSLVKRSDRKGLISFLDEILAQGYDLIEFYLGLSQYFRSLLLLKLEVEPKILGLSSSEVIQIKDDESGFDRANLLKILRLLYSEEGNIKKSLSPRTLLEVISLRMTDFLIPEHKMEENVLGALLKRIEEKHPSLAGSLFSASLRLENNTLFISLPSQNSLVLELIQDSKSFIEKTLSEILNKSAEVIIEQKKREFASGGQKKETTFDKMLDFFNGEEITR